MDHDVVFPVEIGVVVGDCDVVTVFHVDCVFTIATAHVVADLSEGRMPDRDPVFAGGSKSVVFDLEMLNSAYQINAPVFKASRMGDQLIAEDSEIVDRPRFHIGVHSGRQRSMRRRGFNLGSAVTQSNIAHGGGPHVDPQSFQYVAALEAIVDDVALIVVVNGDVAG